MGTRYTSVTDWGVLCQWRQCVIIAFSSPMVRYRQARPPTRVGECVKVGDNCVEAKVGLLGRGQRIPLYQLGGLWKRRKCPHRCKLPSS